MTINITKSDNGYNLKLEDANGKVVVAEKNITLQEAIALIQEAENDDND